MEAVKRFIRDEQGLETVEYAIILGLIVAGTIGLIVSIGGWVETQFSTVDSTLAGTGAAATT